MSMHYERLANKRQTKIHKWRQNDSHITLKVATYCWYIYLYARQDLAGHGLTGKTIDNKILISCHRSSI
jgi:hypothetical protein